MLEIRKEDGPRGIGHELYLDGVYVSEDDAQLTRRTMRFDISTLKFELEQKIVNLTCSALPTLLHDLRFSHVYLFPEIESIVRFTNPAGKFLLSFEFNIDVRNWKEDWTVSELFLEIERLEKEKPITNGKLLIHESSTNIRFVFPIHTETLTIHSLLRRCQLVVNQFMAEVESNLAARVHEDSIVIPFDFPEEIRVSCEQYLLYFVQFLKDLGVEANAEVRHEAERVLFSVTPADGKEALEKLRQVLDVYLDLPSRIGDGTSMSLSSEIEVQRLVANVMHLNGQLALGQALVRTQIAQLEAKDAVIEAKTATIEAKEVTIWQLSQGNVFERSMLVQDKRNDANKNELWSGIFTLKPVDLKIGELNLDALFKVIRQALKPDKEDRS